MQIRFLIYCDVCVKQCFPLLHSMHYFPHYVLIKNGNYCYLAVKNFLIQLKSSYIVSCMLPDFRLHCAAKFTDACKWYMSILASVLLYTCIIHKWIFNFQPVLLSPLTSHYHIVTKFSKNGFKNECTSSYNSFSISNCFFSDSEEIES